MIPFVKRLSAQLLAPSLLAIAGFGCKTAKGFGKDMENAGEEIQDGTK